MSFNKNSNNKPNYKKILFEMVYRWGNAGLKSVDGVPLWEMKTYRETFNKAVLQEYKAVLQRLETVEPK